jgi:hypothetical protein
VTNVRRGHFSTCQRIPATAEKWCPDHDSNMGPPD